VQVGLVLLRGTCRWEQCLLSMGEHRSMQVRQSAFAAFPTLASTHSGNGLSVVAAWVELFEYDFQMSLSAPPLTL
jgi:hypothetical protein